MSDLPTLVVMAKVPGTSTHLTFAFKHACTDEEQTELIEEFKEEFGALLPIRCRFGEERMVGPNENLAAYAVDLCDDDVLERLDKFWHRHQRREEGARMFNFTPHITLKSEQKRKEADALKAKSDDGEFDVEYVCVRTLRDKRVVASVSSTATP